MRQVSGLVIHATCDKDYDNKAFSRKRFKDG